MCMLHANSMSQSSLVHALNTSKALNSCINKFQKENLKNKNTQFIQELLELLQTANNSVLSHSVCSTIQSYVISGVFTTTEVQNKLISLIPCGINQKWLIQLSLELLLLEFKSAATFGNECGCSQIDEYTGYNLWVKPHPLVSIVLAYPSSFSCVLKSFQEVLFNCHATTSSVSLSNFLQIMKPFMLYVLCNPNMNQIVDYQVANMFGLLLNNVQLFEYSTETLCKNENHNLTIINLLTDVIPLVEMNELSINLFVQLMIAAINSPQTSDATLKKLLFICLTVCHTIIQNPESRLVAAVILQIISRIPFASPMLIFSVCHLTCIAAAPTVYILLTIINKILDHLSKTYITANCRLVLFCVKTCVLQVLSTKTLVNKINVRNLSHYALDSVTNLIKQLGDDLPNHSAFFFNNESWKSYIFPNTYLYNLAVVIEAAKYLPCLDFILSQLEVQEVGLIIVIVLCSQLMSYVTVDQTNPDKLNKIMNSLILAVKNCNGSAITVLPCILNLLNDKKRPDLVKRLLLLLPRLSDQYSITPILKIIQNLSMQENLRSMAIYLMLKLWQKQDRCYPYLYNMLVQKNIFLNKKNKTEVDTMKGFVVLTICSKKPHKYQQDMLHLITETLGDSLQTLHIPLALEALCSLCENEIVNLPSVWEKIKPVANFASKINIRLSVLKLLSNIPIHDTGTEYFQQFKEVCLTWIWNQFKSINVDLRGNTIVCLAHFQQVDLKMKYLPEEFQPILPNLQDKQSNELKENYFEKPIPGDCLVKLALDVSIPTEQAHFFLTSTITRELENLPRDIKHRAMNFNKCQSLPAAVEGISPFVFRLYERNKQPNLKASLALALLTCFSPQCDKNVEGVFIPASLIACGRKFTQMLQTLLSEVSLDPKNWQNNIQASIAWKFFMCRCYNAVVAGRAAELQSQLKQKLGEESDLKNNLSTCQYSCRDKLTDIIKTASKGTPSMQGNAVFALAGLAYSLKVFRQTSVAEFKSMSETMGTGFINNNHWILMAVSTITKIIEPSYHSKTRVFSWCQYRAVSDSGHLSTSQLGKVCALYALPIVTPVLYPKHEIMLEDILNIFDSFLSKIFTLEGREVGTSVLTLPMSICYGQVTAQVLRNTHGKAETKLKSDNCIKIFGNLLEYVVKNIDNNDSEMEESDYAGPVIGAGALCCAMMLSNDGFYHKLALKWVLKLENILDLSEMSSSSFILAVCASISWTIILCVKTKLVENVIPMLQSVKKVCDNHQNNCTFARLLSYLYKCVSTEGVYEAQMICKDLFTKWNEEICKSNLSTRQKLAAIAGLSGMAGSEKVLIPFINGISESNKDVSHVVKVLQKAITDSRDPSIIGNASIMLGCIYMSNQDVYLPANLVPSSYNYLPTPNVLQPIYDTLSSLKYGSNKKNSKIYKLVKALSVCSFQPIPFPPVNWNLPLFSDLNVLQDREQESCLQFCLNVSTYSDATVNILSTWTQAICLQKLSFFGQNLLLKSLPILCKCLADDKCCALISTLPAIIKQNPKLSTSILTGMSNSFCVPDLSAGIVKALSVSTSVIFSEMPLYKFDANFDVRIWNSMTECVFHCSNCESLASLENNMIYDDKVVIKFTLVQLYLVKCGKPLQSLLECLLWCSKITNFESKTFVVWLFHYNAIHWKQSSKETLSDTKCIEWLQEYFNMVKNSNCDTKGMVLLVKVLMVVIIAFNSNSTNYETLITEFARDDIGRKFVWQHFTWLFPANLSQLLGKLPWSEKFIAPVIDWLISVTQMDFEIDRSTKMTLCQSLVVLRNTKTFSKPSVWTRAVSTLLL